jgi:uncharacterized membrane protein YdbT with pleckstrin-like domain
MTQPTLPKEEAVWTGHPSHVVNLWTYVLCGLFCWLIIPIFIALWKWVLIRSVRYELTSQRILITTGVFSKETDTLELYRVKDIRIQEPFWFRMFGVGNVHLDTSDRSTPTFTFEAVHEARGLADKLRSLVEALRTSKGVREMDMDVEHTDGSSAN